MKKTGRPKNDNICTRLARKLGQRTVLGVGIPILRAHIDAMAQGAEFRGLTAHEVEEGFRQLAAQYIKSDFHSTYMVRPLSPGGFLDRIGDRYRIREELLEGVSLDALRNLLAQLLDSLKSAYEKRQAVIAELERTNALSPDCVQERSELIVRYLSQLAGNRGETFEVVSFAVLREYFRTFGFSLQSFSTIHANDGGMDFVGGEAIYQVSVDPSLNKVRKDLVKSPGTKRVLVRPAASAELLDMCKTQVLETIDLQDLLSHFIGWLVSRDARGKQAKHLCQVLTVALEEFRRENRAERA